MYDVLVIGLGAMGSAALYHLAGRGAKVIGVDRFAPPHALGSTHGRSRIIREAYYEHPGYVPLVRRAYENWDALERRAGEPLYAMTGGVMIGDPQSGLVRGSLESATRHGIAVEVLAAEEIRRRFPALAPRDGMVGIYERRAGVLFPEACVSAHLRLAVADGAEVRVNTRIERLEMGSGHVTATFDGGSIVARGVVLAAGPWTSELLDALGAIVQLTVERQTMHWLADGDADDRFAPSRMPIALIEHEQDRLFYAIPDFGDGVKAAIHYEGEHEAIGEISRTVTSSDTQPVLQLVRHFLPDAPRTIRESAVCAYTNTADLHFVVDVLPARPEMIIVSACSGHGFKFASALGELIAQRALGEDSVVDISQFALSRFG